jgi:L-arabinose transport system permease protein
MTEAAAPPKAEVAAPPKGTAPIRRVLAARTGSGRPTAGSEGLELKAITAAFLGGCAIAGGRGTIGGTLLAVALLGALENGLTVMGVNPFWQNVAQGTLLVVAVVIQQRRTGERAVGLPS